jgi:hypothetical protein
MVLFIIGLLALGIVIGFLISTMKNLNRFNRLDINVQEKILLLEYYMAVVHQLSNEELIKLSKFPDEEIKYFNTVHDLNMRIQSIQEKLTN